jgi:hypothetical protein
MILCLSLYVKLHSDQQWSVPFYSHTIRPAAIRSNAALHERITNDISYWQGDSLLFITVSIHERSHGGHTQSRYKVRLYRSWNYWTGRRRKMKTMHDTQVTVEVKVRFPLYTPLRHKGSGGTTPVILNPSTKWGWVLTLSLLTSYIYIYIYISRHFR